jgi:hypothetical protein
MVIIKEYTAKEVKAMAAFEGGRPPICVAYGFLRILLTQAVDYTHSMSKRLQVLLPDPEIEEIRKLAKREQLTVGEWVRRALREARSQRSLLEPQSKLKAVRKAAEHSFPTADIDQMLMEIEQGYQR